MRILIKLGGTLLDDADSRARLAREIASLVPARGSDEPPRYEAVIVHGGGKQMTRFLAERGVESQFINGLRVTTPEIIDAVVKVFAGSVNTQLVSAFRAAGANPVGLTGLDAGLVDAEILSPALGQVGKPVCSEAALVELLVRHRYLPVLACVAGDSEGHIFNVNADQMAVALAISFRVNKLLFITDVDGVRDGKGETREVLTAAEARELIDSGVATGGMQAKLEAALLALHAGVAEVLIGPGTDQGIPGLLLSGSRIGTRLVP
jgi:acetylglutamate kinase